MTGDLIFRNLTGVYMKYRADHRHRKNRFAGSFLTENTSARLLQSSGTSSAPDIELDVLPPQWVDTVDEAQENIGKIKEKIAQLKKAQEKRLRQVFAPDSDVPDRDIEMISAAIGTLFKKCEELVRAIQTKGADLGLTDKEYVLRQNVQRNLATQLQSLSQEFRSFQKGYVAALKSRSNAPAVIWDDPQMAHTGGQLSSGQMQQLDDFEFNVNSRNEEIKKIAQSVQDLHTMFKEMAVLVIDQGSMLDRIDYNVEQVVNQSREANVELHKAEKAHKSARATRCIMFFVLGIVLEMLLLMLKWGS